MIASVGFARTATCLCVLVGAVFGSSDRARANGTGAPKAQADSLEQFDHDHVAWTLVLSHYVLEGLVDYASMKREGSADLDSYLRSLESVPRDRYASWSRIQQLAFWINAYNAYTVRLVLDHYPLKSIRSIGLIPGQAFRKRFIPLNRLKGHVLSLDEIEHEILRGEFREPRVHFALVCASKSCPALRSEAYRAEDVEAQLDDAARAFLHDASKNRFEAASRTMYLSPIFKWFREDFGRDATTLLEFVARYAPEPTAGALESGSVRIEFLDYDWSLNGR